MTAINTLKICSPFTGTSKLCPINRTVKATAMHKPNFNTVDFLAGIFLDILDWTKKMKLLQYIDQLIKN